MTREEAIKKLESLKISFPAAKDEISEIIKLIESPWIGVEDDLPCNHKELIHSNYTDRVLTMSRYGYTEVAFMCIIEDAWEWSNLIEVLYWMPIPKLPKE